MPNMRIWRPRWRSSVIAGLALVISFAPASPASAAGTYEPAAATCQPVIKHVSTFKAVKAPDVTITGTCFGTGGAYSGDSPHFRITDLGPHGTLAEMAKSAARMPVNVWHACAKVPIFGAGYTPDNVTCKVPAWTGTSVRFYSFGSVYGKAYHVIVGGGVEVTAYWRVKPGDKIAVQVWNANTMAGPSVYLVTAASS
jgi:hypothetical protein